LGIGYGRPIIVDKGEPHATFVRTGVYWKLQCHRLPAK
jgi:hypothetical protein